MHSRNRAWYLGIILILEKRFASSLATERHFLRTGIRWTRH